MVHITISLSLDINFLHWKIHFSCRPLRIQPHAILTKSIGSACVHHYNTLFSKIDDKPIGTTCRSPLLLLAFQNQFIVPTLQQLHRFRRKTIRQVIQTSTGSASADFPQASIKSRKGSKYLRSFKKRTWKLGFLSPSRGFFRLVKGKPTHLLKQVLTDGRESNQPIKNPRGNTDSKKKNDGKMLHSSNCSFPTTDQFCLDRLTSSDPLAKQMQMKVTAGGDPKYSWCKRKHVFIMLYNATAPALNCWVLRISLLTKKAHMMQYYQ